MPSSKVGWYPSALTSTRKVPGPSAPRKKQPPAVANGYSGQVVLAVTVASQIPPSSSLRSVTLRAWLDTAIPEHTCCDEEVLPDPADDGVGDDDEEDDSIGADEGSDDEEDDSVGADDEPEDARDTAEDDPGALEVGAAPDEDDDEDDVEPSPGVHPVATSRAVKMQYAARIMGSLGMHATIARARELRHQTSIVFIRRVCA